MKCLKCGRETEQTFCDLCRADMEKYPVKPGTYVLLPKERTIVRKAPVRHSQIPLEAVVKGQRRLIRRLGRGVVVLTVLLVLLAGFTIRLMTSPSTPPVGQNYSTVTKPSTETTEPAADSTEPAELEDASQSEDSIVSRRED